MPKPRIGKVVPKPKYNIGSRWCAHQEIQSVTHETTRGCKHYSKRLDKRNQKKECKTCVFSGLIIKGKV